MQSIPIQPTITTREAATLLGVTVSAISWMNRRGLIKRISTGVYSRASVLSQVGQKEIHVANIHRKLIDVIREHFEDYGEPPTYRYIQSITKIPSTNTIRWYVLRMEKLGLVEIYKGHIYLPGLRDKIRELVRVEYPK